MQDALGAADGAGDDVGEERNECSMIEEAARKDQLLIAIYQIHDLREGKETDAERKGEVRHEKLWAVATIRIPELIASRRQGTNHDARELEALRSSALLASKHPGG